MAQPAILVTGANGELGHALIDYLTSHGGGPVITLDLRPPDAFVAGWAKGQAFNPREEA